MAFLVGGANSAAVTAYDIDNSVRLDGTSAYMRKTLGTPTSQRKLTLSCWSKSYNQRSGGDDNKIMSAGESGDSHYTNILNLVRTNGTPQIYISDTDQYWLNFNNTYFRDPSAWYHWVVAIDTTQGVATNRMKWYVNGVQLSNTIASHEAQPTQNYDIPTLASGQSVTIGGDTRANDHFFDGYLSEIHFIDGLQLTPSSFGETDEDSGIWKPKEADVTYGTNGFFLEFKQSGTDADASGIGADTSGNDNHFTLTNVAATDQCTDSPTNNFATLNPLEGINTSIDPDQLSEGNLKLKGRTSASGGAGDVITRSSIIIPTTGKWYAEYYNDGSDSNTILIGLADASLTNHRQAYHTGVYVRCDNGNKYTITTSSTDNGSYATGWDANEIFGVAYDADAGTLTYYLNGSTQGTAFSSLTGQYYFGTATIGGADLLATVNFGNPPFAISSGNADANGYGNFEYAPPSGHYALCTKNLAEFG